MQKRQSRGTKREAQQESVHEGVVARHLKNVPSWVKRVLMEFARQASPALDKKSLTAAWSDTRPERLNYTLGAIMGHWFAAAAVYRAGEPPFTGERRTHFTDSLGMSMIAVQESLTAACDWPLKEAKEFFAGFSKALSKGTFKPQTGELVLQTEAILILDVLVRHWREVEAMKSVPEVTRWLQNYFEKNYPKQLNLARSITDVRIGKICWRYKIKTRKRPC